MQLQTQQPQPHPQQQTDLRAPLFRILAKFDLTEKTPKEIRAKLEKKLGLAEGALDSRKDEVKTLIQEFLDQNKEDPEIVALRKMASALRVPPQFWKAVDKADYKKSLETHLIDFALAKKVVEKRRLPTESELKSFKKKREREADLEGLSTDNIISSKRRRSADLFPL